MKKVHAKCEKNTRKLFIVCTGFVSPRFGIHGELLRRPLNQSDLISPAYSSSLFTESARKAIKMHAFYITLRLKRVHAVRWFSDGNFL